MKLPRGVIIFGFIEILIGAITLTAVLLTLIQGKSAKPLEVLIFVIATSIISIGLGAGILRKSLSAYNLLLFFATIIILSKILVLAKIIALSGEIETTVPAPTKNLISIFYHSLLLYYFSRQQIKEQFGGYKEVLFALRLPCFKLFSGKFEKND